MCTRYQQGDSITQLLLIWGLLSSALPHFPVSIQETQNKIVQTPFFEEHNYNQVEKSIWECWHWSFSSFSPWLPLKMRYSKTLVKEPTKIFFAPRAVWIHRPLLSYNFSSGLFCTWIYCPYAFFHAVLSVSHLVSFVSFPSMAPLLSQQLILLHNKVTLLNGL